MPRQPLDVLRTVFGLRRFPRHQAEIIDHVVPAADALVLMPTGGGSRSDYQVPASAARASPSWCRRSSRSCATRSRHCARLDVRARGAQLQHFPSSDAMKIGAAQMRAGEIDLVYVAPERLADRRLLDLLDRCRWRCSPSTRPIASRNGPRLPAGISAAHVLHTRYPQVPAHTPSPPPDAAHPRDIIERLDLGRAASSSRLRRPNTAIAVP